ncbi:pentapeptide repeat-containing protein [Patescibacteria group bacterium]|nr:pentapeptide repeat-containing protein [Patescibacteria group bacterium]
MPAWKQAGLDGRGRYRVDILARKIREGLINVNQLAGANLCRARVSRADLRDADLHGANLFGANLFGADLFKADLRGADLRGANLTEATVDEANLTNAKLEGAICYTSDDLPESIRHDFDENGRYHAAVPASEPINPENLPPETIFVRNAKNPFREAFVDGGVVAPERKDAVWNLVEKCHEDMAVYQDCEIESWARNLAGRENKLRNLSAEKKRIIESEIAEGAIPIIMPGKRVQLETTIEQIKMLRPKFKNEDGVETLANESNLSWSHLKQLIAQRDALLVSGIPDGPYILLMKPTQKSELRGKTMGAQRAEIAAINENRSAERKIYAINLYEYAAAQTIRSKMIINRSEAGRTELSQVRPMDFDYKAYTRFVSLNVPGGLVPCGRWHSVQHKLDFDSVNAVERGPFLGVRLVLRLEI